MHALFRLTHSLCQLIIPNGIQIYDFFTKSNAHTHTHNSLTLDQRAHMLPSVRGRRTPCTVDFQTGLAMYSHCMQTSSASNTPQPFFFVNLNAYCMVLDRTLYSVVSCCRQWIRSKMDLYNAPRCAWQFLFPNMMIRPNSPANPFCTLKFLIY